MSAHPTSRQQRRILVLASSGEDDDHLLAALAALGEVRTVATAADALAALRTGRFDAIVSRPGDLFTLARSEARQRGELILDRIGQGLCVVDRTGDLIWANPQLNAYSRKVVDAIRRQCTELCAQLAAERAPRDAMRSRRRIVRVDDHVFDLAVSPLLYRQTHLEEVVGLVWDVTASQRLQSRIDTIDAAGRELVRMDVDALTNLDVSERLRYLEDKIVRFAHELLRFDHFVIRVLDRKTNKLESVIASGLSEEAQSLDIYATAEGNGISGYVAATGRSYICPDVARDPRYLPGLEHAGSSLTVPLRLQDQVVGIFNVESNQIAAFSEDDRQFAEMFGRYVAIALHILRLLAAERSTTTGQITSDVASELSTPLNDIIAEATGVIEEYANQEDVQRRLRAIIDHVDRVKRNLQTMSDHDGVRGLVPEAPARDGIIDGRRILVADDEDIIRETISDVLSKSGALTVTARDGQEAISMMRAQHFDLVISDIKMPYKNGYEVFSVAKETNIHCPVILITGFGYDPDHSIVKASREGLAGVLFKPFKVDQLLDLAREALTPAGGAP